MNAACRVAADAVGHAGGLGDQHEEFNRAVGVSGGAFARVRVRVTVRAGDDARGGVHRA